VGISVSAAPTVIRAKGFIAEATRFILEQAHKALAERNEFRIALSGGKTPAPVYGRIAEKTRGSSWERVRFTFGDERCVPPDDPQSNFRMARKNLFLPAHVPESSIMRMRGEISPQIAAQEYGEQLNALATQQGESIYRHDLILLGLGDDGHTASLFPGTAALDEMKPGVAANFVAKLDAWRLTFTFPLINHARHVLFLVGSSKSPQLIERVIAGDQQFPAARVHPSAGDVTWIIDES
jgi:6-phosphogluconolactonase